MVLAGLRTRYVIPNLAVSDTFTASTSLERHLTGLDFSAKLLNTEVIHGINDLVTFLGGTGDLEGDAEIVAADSFSRYQTYFQDRQNVLAHSTEKLQEYELLTQPRSLKVYETIRRANTVLIVWGTLALFATLFFTFTGAFGWTDLTAAAITGGLTLAPFVGAFFTRPSADLQRNLTNLAVFKMILESHSLKTALARFHLTTPQALRELETEPEAKAAGRQVEALRAELGGVADVDGADFAALARLGFGPGAEEAEAAAANGANGSSRPPTVTAHRSRPPGTRPPRTAATPDDRVAPSPAATSLDGVDEAVVVRRSPRRKRWSLTVPWDGPVTPPVPQRMSAAEIERVLASYGGWIARQRAGQVPRLGLDPRDLRGRRAPRRARARDDARRGGGRGARRLATSGSRSAASARAGARARRAARSRSTGGSRSRRSRCSTTSSCTSSATCASRTTRGASGRSSRAAVPTGAPARLAARARRRAARLPAVHRSGLKSQPVRAISVPVNLRDSLRRIPCTRRCGSCLRSSASRCSASRCSRCVRRPPGPSTRTGCCSMRTTSSAR